MSQRSDKDTEKEEDHVSDVDVSDPMDIDFDRLKTFLIQFITKLRHVKVGVSELSSELVKQSQGTEENKEFDEYPEHYDRSSYIRRRQINRWPPTTNDLLEYITIYSQMNNMKFASMNQEKVEKSMRKKKSIKKKKKAKDSTPFDGPRTPRDTEVDNTSDDQKAFVSTRYGDS